MTAVRITGEWNFFCPHDRRKRRRDIDQVHARDLSFSDPLAGDHERSSHLRELLAVSVLRFLGQRGPQIVTCNVIPYLISFLSSATVTGTPVALNSSAWRFVMPESVISLEISSTPHILTRELTPSLELSAITIVSAAASIILGIFSFLPHESMGIAAGMTITLCISACVYSMRAVYFAPMDEVSVPREITGSAMSMASFIGYLPGAFMYAVYGGILDSFSGLSGYRIVFIMMTVFAVCGVLLSTFIVRKLVKKS